MREMQSTLGTLGTYSGREARASPCASAAKVM
jgi:hypothetical protein